jgi:hypothetical protein
MKYVYNNLKPWGIYRVVGDKIEFFKNFLDFFSSNDKKWLIFNLNSQIYIQTIKFKFKWTNHITKRRYRPVSPTATLPRVLPLARAYYTTVLSLLRDGRAERYHPVWVLPPLESHVVTGLSSFGLTVPVVFVQMRYYTTVEGSDSVIDAFEGQ